MKLSYNLSAPSSLAYSAALSWTGWTVSNGWGHGGIYWQVEYTVLDLTNETNSVYCLHVRRITAIGLAQSFRITTPWTASWFFFVSLWHLTLKEVKEMESSLCINIKWSHQDQDHLLVEKSRLSQFMWTATIEPNVWRLGSFCIECFCFLPKYLLKHPMRRSCAFLLSKKWKSVLCNEFYIRC